MIMKFLLKRCCYFSATALLVVVFTSLARSQTLDVSAHVEVTSRKGRVHPARSSSADVVIWLIPTRKAVVPVEPRKMQTYTLIQKDKKFIPHLLVVPVGSNVDFPNLDPFFHNVFSLFNGKRFDLGLYEAHTHRAVKFDREGVSYIFCNIHPEMGAVIIALDTPYYGISKSDGTVVIHNVPPGSYRLRMWAENVDNDHLDAVGRMVEITPQNTELGKFHLIAVGDLMSHHENKFGEDYPSDATDSY